MPTLTPEGLSDEEVTALDNMHWCRTGHFAPVAEMARHRSMPGGIDTICRPCDAARTRAAKQARVDAGLCRDCDEPAEPGHSYCADHLAAKRARRRERVDAGLCRDCDEPAEPGHTRCAEHMAADAAAQRARRERYIAQGYCKHGPGHGPVVAGTTRCRACWERRNARNVRRAERFWAAHGIDAWTCWLCCLPIADGDRHIDHVVPRNPRHHDSKGSDLPSNQRPAHTACNLAKSDNDPWPYLVSMWDDLGPEEVHYL